VTTKMTDFFGDRRHGVSTDLAVEPELSPDEAALIAESTAKSNVIWVRPSDGVRDHLAWHVWHADAVHVIYGVDEQMLPQLAGMVEVTARSKDNGARSVRFLARADALPTGSPEWDAAADALSASRLNARDTDTQRERWAAGCRICRLTPIRMLSSGAGDADAPSGSRPPARTGATTISWRPWHLGGRPARRRGTPVPR
jgi:hypothetical protein